MKPVYCVLLSIVILFGFDGEKWGDPFKEPLISEHKVHIFENQKALKTVKEWKRAQMIEAYQSANPYYFGDGIILKGCTEVNAYILDCRK